MPLTQTPGSEPNIDTRSSPSKLTSGNADDGKFAKPHPFTAGCRSVATGLALTFAAEHPGSAHDSTATASTNHLSGRLTEVIPRCYTTYYL